MRSVTALALGFALLMAACVDDDAALDVGSPGDSASTTDDRPEDDADTTTTGEVRHEWCDTWARLRDAEEPGDEELRAAAETAPDSIRDEVASLAATESSGDARDDLAHVAAS